MSKKANNIMFFIMAVVCFLIGGAQVVRADFPEYTIDQAPLNPPTFDDYEVIDVYDANGLTNEENGLPATSNDKVIYRLQNDVQLTSQIKIVNNKAIDLNQHTIEATSGGYLLVEQANKSTENFKLYNGTISGGPNYTSLGDETTTNRAFFNAPVKRTKNANKVRNLVIEDIQFTSQTTGGSFVSALATNVFALGTVSVSTYATNIRAGNMTFLGDFTGYAFGNGDPGERVEGSGGLNISFGGTNVWTNISFINQNNFGSETMNQSNGDRRVSVAKEANVTLTNTNTGSRSYANNIGNFSSINVDGSLICQAVASSLRTTASYNAPKDPDKPYESSAGTFNGEVNITVNEGATFHISSTDTKGTYGAIYTYRTNIYVNQAKSFDIRYFGTGNFFYAYTPSNMYIKGPMNLATWTKAQAGIGDPTLSWLNVDWMTLTDFTKDSSKPGTVDSSNSDLKANFSINNYSRISSDAGVPVIVAPEEINNGETTFSGSTKYMSGTTVVDGVVAGATVTLKIGNKTYTTTTDSEGKWMFSDLNLSTLVGGTKGTINLTDTDQRTAEQVTTTVKDTTPPSVTKKVIKVKVGTANGLDDPKAGIKSASDETTAASKLTYAYETSQADRDKMLKTAGVDNVEVNVSDEAGNTTTASVPVIVYGDSTVPTKGFVNGNDFEVDYNTWKSASDDQKKSMVISNGVVKGYTVTDSDVTEVSADSMGVSIPSGNWEPNKTYNVSVTVSNYTKTIQVTLVPSTVKMTVKQVYAGTDTAIYSDLEKKTTVDNTQSTEVEIGANIEDVISNLEKNNKFTLNYNGYSTQTSTNYKVYQNGTEVTPTPTTVPDADFTIVYEYRGQLKFGNKVATNLTFGSIAITGNSSDTPLTDTSDRKISIINTLKNSNWTLKAAVPNGITSDKDKVFLGSLIYKNGSDNEQVIGSAATTIESQSDDSLLSELDLKNGSEGLYLQQNSGNLKGSYSGKVVWTLEDSP